MNAQDNWVDWLKDTFLIPVSPLAIAVVVRALAGRPWLAPLAWNYEVPFSALILWGNILRVIRHSNSVPVALVRNFGNLFSVLMGCAVFMYYADDVGLWGMQVPDSVKHRMGVVSSWVCALFAGVAVGMRYYDTVKAAATKRATG